MTLEPIKQCFVIVRTDRDGSNKLLGMHLERMDAYEQVVKYIKESSEPFEEGVDENDATVWVHDDATLEIRPCPCHLELP